jgi:rubrerythrin
MLSQAPIDLGKVKQNEVDKEALRLAIIAELDAVSLYEQLAAVVKKDDLRKVLLEVAREEKTHVGEFQALLLKYDEEQAEELDKGRKEVEELTEK